MKNLSTGAEILERLISELGITIYELANTCGYKREQAFYDVQKGKTKNISSVMANRIVSAYPNVRLEFLYSGEGNTLKDHIETEGTDTLSITYGQPVEIAHSTPLETMRVATGLLIEHAKMYYEREDISRETGISEKDIKKARNTKHGLGLDDSKKIIEYFNKKRYAQSSMDIIKSEDAVKPKEYYMGKCIELSDIISIKDNEIINLEREKSVLKEEIARLKKSSDRPSSGTEDAKIASKGRVKEAK